jgi:hypothetical protein
MPKYKITDNQTGKAVTVSGDSAPTEQEAEQIFADAGLRASASETTAPKPSGVVDSIRALPGGLAKGAAGVLGAPRDVGDLLDAGVRWAGNKISPGAGDKAAEFNSQPGLGTAITGIKLPGSKPINDFVSKPFGGYYKPQTTPGKYAETIASFAPNALVPGGAAARVANVAIPAIGSEAAGQATEGTKLEPMARAAGALGGGLLSGGVQGALAHRQNPAPTIEALEQAKRAAYHAAEQQGVVISPAAWARVANNANQRINGRGLTHPDIHPNALAALDVVQQEAAAGIPITLERADLIRQAVNGAIERASGANGSRSDLRAAMQVREELDNFLDGLTPADTIAGNAQVATPILREARDLARREAKGREIQTIIDLAENQASSNYSASGVEQALRVQFKNLNAKLIKNRALANTFTAAERDAIQRVARGGATGNALRLLGKFAPTGVISGGAGVGMGAYVGGLLGGPVGAAVGSAALPAAGAASRAGATGLTRRNANIASEMVRRGAPVQPAGVQSPRQLMIDALLSQQTAN